ncbi:MAG: hypothetical protein AAF497_12860, partial [Planctomycetota bacterium]
TTPAEPLDSTVPPVETTENMNVETPTVDVPQVIRTVPEAPQVEPEPVADLPESTVVATSDLPQEPSTEVKPSEPSEPILNPLPQPTPLETAATESPIATEPQPKTTSEEVASNEQVAIAEPRTPATDEAETSVELVITTEPIETPEPIETTDSVTQTSPVPVVADEPTGETPTIPSQLDGIPLGAGADGPAPMVTLTPTPSSEPTLPSSQPLAPIAQPEDHLPEYTPSDLPSLSDEQSTIPVEPSEDKAEPQDEVDETPKRRRGLGKLRRVPRAKKSQTEEVLPTSWPPAKALLRTFQDFKDPQAIAWSSRVAENLARLQRAKSLDALDATLAIEQLAELSTTAKEMAKSIPDRQQQALLVSTGYDLQRRVVVWSAVTHAIQPSARQMVNRTLVNRDASRMNETLGELAEALGGNLTARQWVGFLEMNEIARLNVAPLKDSIGDTRNVAIRVLDRLASVNLSDQQAQVINSRYVQNLANELRGWATVPIDYKRLLLDIEKYEYQSTSTVNNSLSAAISQMLWSMSPEQNRIGKLLDTHYRNANLRVAMTQKFMQRMLPVMQDVRIPVRDQILGARVFGDSASWTRIGVGLIPDPERINLQLQARGHVAANTRSFKGPVIIYNRNRSEFFLRKPLIFSNDGIYIGRSDTIANTTLKTLGMRTQYDNYPLIGSIVRRSANREFFEQRHLVRRILDRRVASDAQRQVDNELSRRLAQTQQRLKEKLVDPLDRLGLKPTNMTMQTTSDRIIYRGRLAGDHQLASYTARPQALANNLVSLQFHESTVNNLLQQVKLNGVEGELSELIGKLSERLKSFEMQTPDDIPENVFIKMANSDAVTVRFVDGIMRVTLRIREIKTKRRSWKNFAVTASYVPTGKGFQIEVNRTGVVELQGRRLGMRDQVALRGIFTKVFSKNRTSKLLHPNLANDSRLADLNVNQIVMRNGWVGVSVGTDGSVTYANRPTENTRR